MDFISLSCKITNVFTMNRMYVAAEMETVPPGEGGWCAHVALPCLRPPLDSRENNAFSCLLSAVNDTSLRGSVMDLQKASSNPGSGQKAAAAAVVTRQTGFHCIHRSLDLRRE